MSTVAIRGGHVVLEDREVDADVLIEDGLITVIGTGEGEDRADEEIDARGCVVLPGVVDAHVHFNEPGRADWEGWACGTAGAAAGGVTTVADMPLNSLPPTITPAAFLAKRAAAERVALVDFALWGGVVGMDRASLEALHALGAVGFKAFLCDSGVAEFPPLDGPTLVRVLGAATALGALVAVHAEDEATIRRASEPLHRAARRDAGAWSASRPVEAECTAIGRLGSAARDAGARVHVVHASGGEAVDAVRRARASGARMTVETCPHYLVFDAEEAERVGPMLKCAPPIRSASSQERLWEALANSAVDLVASDHSPTTRERKERGVGGIWEAWGGVTGVQSLLPALFTAGRARGLSLVRIAALLATGPARLLGLYPRKGAIRAGADGDLVLVDPERAWTLDAAHLQARSGLSPYVGRPFRGSVVRTLVRGRTVHRDGAVTGEAGWGRFVPRGT